MVTFFRQGNKFCAWLTFSFLERSSEIQSSIISVSFSHYDRSFIQRANPSFALQSLRSARKIANLLLQCTHIILEAVFFRFIHSSKPLQLALPLNSELGQKKGDFRTIKVSRGDTHTFFYNSVRNHFQLSKSSWGGSTNHWRKLLCPVFYNYFVGFIPPPSVRNAFGNYFQVSNKRTIPQLLKEVGEYPFYILKWQFEVISSHSGSFGGLLKSF